MLGGTIVPHMYSSSGLQDPHVWTTDYNSHLGHLANGKVQARADGRLPPSVVLRPRWTTGESLRLAMNHSFAFEQHRFHATSTDGLGEIVTLNGRDQGIGRGGDDTGRGKVSRDQFDAFIPGGIRSVCSAEPRGEAIVGCHVRNPDESTIIVEV